MTEKTYCKIHCIHWSGCLLPFPSICVQLRIWLQSPHLSQQWRNHCHSIWWSIVAIIMSLSIPFGEQTSPLFPAYCNLPLVYSRKMGIRWSTKRLDSRCCYNHLCVVIFFILLLKFSYGPIIFLTFSMMFSLVKHYYFAKYFW